MLISCLGAQERGCTYHGSNNHFVSSVCHCNTASSKTLGLDGHKTNI